jgi:hypothetical protein
MKELILPGGGCGSRGRGSHHLTEQQISDCSLIVAVYFIIDTDQTTFLSANQINDQLLMPINQVRLILLLTNQMHLLLLSNKMLLLLSIRC